MVLTKEIELPTELFELAVKEFDCTWTNGTIKIKRFDYGDNIDITRSATKVKTSNTGLISADVDIADISIQTILKGVLDAPWAINDVPAIRKLPSPIAIWVAKKIEEFNTIDFKKKES